MGTSSSRVLLQCPQHAVPPSQPRARCFCQLFPPHTNSHSQGPAVSNILWLQVYFRHNDVHLQSTNYIQGEGMTPAPLAPAVFVWISIIRLLVAYLADLACQGQAPWSQPMEQTRPWVKAHFKHASHGPARGITVTT